MLRFALLFFQLEVVDTVIKATLIRIDKENRYLIRVAVLLIVFSSKIDFTRIKFSNLIK